MAIALRRRLLILLVVALLVCEAACSRARSSSAPAAPQRPPNIVFVLVDDMRWDETRASGHPFIETPNMDRLAREGARFLNAFATTPLCSPSRASFLTGQYAHTHGITDNTARSSHQLPVFPRELQRAGYRTGFFGKWHMGNDDSPRPGFTRWVALPGQGEALDPQLNVDGERIRVGGYVTDVLTDHVEQFIQQSAGSPFLAYLAHKAIHPNVVQLDDGRVAPVPGQPGGFVAAERHRGRYAGRSMPRRPNAFKPPVAKPALLRPIDNLPPLGRGTATTDDEIRGRLEMLLAVDDSLGRIIRTLEKLGTLDNTVVVLTSDHGYFYGEHGLGSERRLAYEETIRIPLIVRYPPLARAGATPRELVMSIDVAPTLLAVAGLTPSARIQGRSLVPILQGAAGNWRSSVLIEYFTDTVYPRIRNMGYTAVRTNRYKYIEYRELKDMDELYDLEADPYEEHNIAGIATARPTRDRMQSELRRLLAETPESLPRMRRVPGGEFTMGSDQPRSMPNERPARRVRVEGFWMDEHPVTNAAFAAFVEATGYATTAERAPDWEEMKQQVPPGTPRPDASVLVPGSLVFAAPARPAPLHDVSAWWRWVPGANWRHPEGPGSNLTGRDSHPVVHVSWEDAAAFATWAGKELPTEAQWEYAARGGLDGRRFAWGDELRPGGHHMANIFHGEFPHGQRADDGFAGTSPVKSFPPNRYGLYDMAGNVWHWTADWYRDGTRSYQQRRVIKGGSFLCHASYCESYRPSARQGAASDTGSSHVGFRLVRRSAQLNQ